jgi:hypothetical protein
VNCAKHAVETSNFGHESIPKCFNYLLNQPLAGTRFDCNIDLLTNKMVNLIKTNPFNTADINSVATDLNKVASELERDLGKCNSYMDILHNKPHLYHKEFPQITTPQRLVEQIDHITARDKFLINTFDINI